MKNALNVVQQFTSYDASAGTTDNPTQRNFDWQRRIYSISVENPITEPRVLPPMSTTEVFSGVRSLGLVSGDTCELSFNLDTSIYNLQTAGASVFRTAKTFTASSASVQINNNSMAIFEFSGLTHTAQVGDVLRIKGYNVNEMVGSFSPINSGLWTITAIDTSRFYCIRPVGQDFSGVDESVATITANDCQVYSASGVQKGDKVILDNFLVFGRKMYEIVDATATQISFCSTESLPVGITKEYLGQGLMVVSSGKKFVYIESDQDIAIKINGDTSTNNIVSPILAGDQANVGFYSKWGPTYSLSITNLSLNLANVRIFTAE